MRVLGGVLLVVLLALAGFVVGGLFARFVAIEDNTGFEGGATVLLCGLIGAAVGGVIAILLARR